MLFLRFQIGADGYLLEAQRIVEILPLVQVKQIPQAPAGVTGLFNYRGEAVPVIDLSQLATGAPAPRRLSTRLVLVHHLTASGKQRLLGLIAEKATETLQRNAGDFTDSAVGGDAPYLGAITHGAHGAARDAERLLQRVDLDKLLPESISSVLYRQAEEESWSLPASKPS